MTTSHEGFNDGSKKIIPDNVSVIELVFQTDNLSTEP